MRNVNEILVGKPEGKRPLERSRPWCEDIKIDLTEICYEDVDWIIVAQDRDQQLDLVNAVMNLRVP